MHGSSPTASLLDHAASGEAGIERLVRGLAVLPGQNAQLELFGHGAALAAHWAPLRPEVTAPTGLALEVRTQSQDLTV